MRIRGIGVNRTEITLRSGRSPAKPPLPAKIGFEAAGVSAIKRLTDGQGADLVFDPVIFPFDEIVEAHRFMEAGNHVGKIVVTV
jgi:NADPH:quinone reductase-like Zn-dependent oxidoreductase